MLAALRSDQLERFLARTDLKGFSSKSIVEIEPLRREIEEVRKNGLAFDDGEFDPEVRCVAVPVRDFTGNVAGAIGISGPVWRMPIQVLQGRVRIVQAAASRLSAEFGFVAETAPPEGRPPEKP